MRRHSDLLKYLHEAKDETENFVNEMHEVINLCELFDDFWLVELNLRHMIDTKQVLVTGSQSRLKAESDSLFNMSEDEIRIIDQRKKYTYDIGVQNQAILKHKTRFEEISHHLNTFSTGLALVMSDPLSACQATLPEQMRCSYNELRRVNSALEEKLVITGVSKQKAMKELRNVLSDLRASCSRNPTKYRALNEDSVDDPNLSSHVIRDINAVWKASLPSVPSLSGEQTHNDLITWLSISMGHFTEECIDDVADVAYTENSKNQTTTHIEEEAQLVGVLSAETQRYRSISSALKCAINDAQELFDSKSFESMEQLIGTACEVIRSRLKCRNVTFWKKSNDRSEAIGFSNCSSNISLCLQPNTQALMDRFPPLFDRSLAVTCSMENLDLESPLLPLDLDCLVTQKLILKKSETERFDAFSVTSVSGGLTVVRGDTDPPFHAFSGIYCEQFYRRIVSSIVPLQMIQSKRISNQRPLDLVECMFELRQMANNPYILAKLVRAHLSRLFKAENVNLFVTFDNDVSRVVLISDRDHIETTIDEEFVNIGNIPERYTNEALNGVTLIQTPSILLDVLRNNTPIALNKQKSRELYSMGLIQDTEIEHTTHIRPISKGRSVVLMVMWTSPAWSPEETFDTTKVMSEAYFNPESASQATILNTYLALTQGLIGRWFNTINSLLDGEMRSYEVENEDERTQIHELLKQSS